MQILGCEVFEYKYYSPYSNDVEKELSKTDKKICKTIRYINFLMNQLQSVAQRGFKGALKKHRLEQIFQVHINRIQSLKEINNLIFSGKLTRLSKITILSIAGLLTKISLGRLARRQVILACGYFSLNKSSAGRVKIQSPILLKVIKRIFMLTEPQQLFF